MIMILQIILTLALKKSLAAESSRIVKCSETSIMSIYTKPQVGTRFNFPIKPDDVVFGGSGLFSVKYVKNDVHVSPLSSSASTNMTVYFLGRSCTFKLVSSNGRHDEIIIVADADSTKMKVKAE